MWNYTSLKHTWWIINSKHKLLQIYKLQHIYSWMIIDNRHNENRNIGISKTSLYSISKSQNQPLLYIWGCKYNKVKRLILIIRILIKFNNRSMLNSGWCSWRRYLANSTSMILVLNILGSKRDTIQDFLDPHPIP